MIHPSIPPPTRGVQSSPVSAATAAPREDVATDHRRRDRFIAWLGVLTAIQLGLFLWYLKATIIRQPFWDMYSYVLHYLQYREDGGLWMYLWEAHGGHRPIWSRLLAAIDVEGFSGAAYPFIVSTTAFQLTAAWLLWRECRSGVPGQFGSALGCIVLMLVLTSVAAVDCAIPIECAYPQALTFSVLAIVLFAGGGEPDGTDRHATHWRRGAALAAAVAAPLGNAVGLVTLPILLWMAWRVRAGRWWIAAVALFGTAFVASYLAGQSIAPGTGAAGSDPPSLASRVDYLITYLGLPWTRAAALAIPGRIVGVILLLAGVWAVIRRGLLGRSAGRFEIVSVALIMFSLGTAVLAAIGRPGVSPSETVLVPVRYSVLLTPLHVGLLFIASPVLYRLWNDRARWPAVAAAMATAAGLLLVQQVGAGQAAVTITSRMRATIARFEAGYTDPGMTTVILSDLEQARRELAIIRGAGLYSNVR